MNVIRDLAHARHLINGCTHVQSFMTASDNKGRYKKKGLNEHKEKETNLLVFPTNYLKLLESKIKHHH